MLLASITLMITAACSNVALPVAAPTNFDTNQDEFAYVASVDIDKSITKAELEAAYGGSVVVFKPDAGFAVLGFETADTLSTLTLSNNQNTYSSPAVQAAGVSGNGWDAWAGGHGAWSGGHGAWSGGWDAWAGGHGAWSGGHGAWSGGHGAWSGGELNGTPMDNYAMWTQIGLPEAHSALARNLGEGVTVAVIDTGVDTSHPVLAANVVPGWNFVDNDSNPQDVLGGSGSGHGTAVAGIILQVAPKASIMPLRTLDENGYGDTDDVTEAVIWAIDNGANVINLSLGSVEDDTVLEQAMQYATNAGVYIVSSAGNEGRQDRLTFPARRGRGSGKLSELLVSVGSVNTSDVKSEFSNYGKDLEMVAPGENIFTTFPNGQITYATGTSFASPIAAGTIALGLGENTKNRDKGDMAKKMVEKVDKIDKVPGNKRYGKEIGKGRLNIPEYLKKVGVGK